MLTKKLGQISNYQTASKAWLLLYPADLDLVFEKGLSGGQFSPSERKRLKSIRHKDTRHQFALARLLAKAVLAEEYGERADSWYIGYGEKGRPLLKNHAAEAPDISISHTRGMVAFAVSPEGLIGVDVENCNRKVDIQLLAREVFSSSESQCFQNLTSELDRRYYFFQNWTLKEAYTKALGLGLYAGFRSIEINSSMQKNLLQTPAKDDHYLTDSWHFHHEVVLESFHVALAYWSDDSSSVTMNWKIQPFSLSVAGREFDGYQISSVL